MLSDKPQHFLGELDANLRRPHGTPLLCVKGKSYDQLSILTSAWYLLNSIVSVQPTYAQAINAVIAGGGDIEIMAHTTRPIGSL